MSSIFEECNEPHYVGEENTLFYIDCGIDVSQATEAKVFLRRPDNTKVEKIATLTTYRESPDFVYFRIAKEDFNQEGKYRGQVFVTIGAWSGWGRSFIIEVEQPISSSSCSSSSKSKSSSSSSCSSSSSSKSSSSSSCSSSSSSCRSSSSSCSSSSSSSA